MAVPFRGFSAAPPPQAPNFRMQFRGTFNRPRAPSNTFFRGPNDHSQEPAITNIDPIALLFVGNIDERCPDSLIQEMLELCGTVEDWKRIQGPDGRYPPFGFCGFAEAAAAVLAIRVLNEFSLGNKRLNVKADEKVKQVLVEYCIKDRIAKRLPSKPPGHELEPDEGDKARIEDLRKQLRELISKQDPTLLSQNNGKDQNGELKVCLVVDSKLTTTSVSDGKISNHTRQEQQSNRRCKQQISIKLGPLGWEGCFAFTRDYFRNNYANDCKLRVNIIHPLGHVINLLKFVETERRSRKRSRASRRSSRSSRSSSTYSRKRRSLSSNSSSSSRTHSYDDGRHSRSEGRGTDSEDSMSVEEKRERKKEQKRKDEEYLKQLKKFEEREKRMAKQYAREDEADQNRKKTLQREAKKLMQFLEDYNDEQDDPKYYKSSAFIQRKKDYEMEREADNRDRQEEAREIAEAKAEVTRELNGKNKKANTTRDESLSPSPHVPLGQSRRAKEEDESSKPFRYSFVEGSQTEIEFNTPSKSEDWTPFSDQPSTSTAPENSKGGQPKVITTFQSKVLSQVSTVFGDDEPEDDEVHVIKKKMKPFEITAQDRIESLTADERKQMIKELIDAIPSNKAELFKHEVDWSHLDNALVVQRIKPWVEKKIREYIGDDEPSLVTFICERVEARSEPTRLLGDLAMILDDEAESFMIKLWRLVIFQTKAKSLGLNVNKT
ncbi:hypothetical protein M3Y95_00195000 [Aphelenchoides besseyi]|nr:hypothetical protein M3Y95_00195000 [Aphelenchoides besseyi]